MSQSLHSSEAPLPEVGGQGAEAVVDGHVAPPPEATPNAARAVRLSVSASLLIQVLNMVSGVELARGLGVSGRGELAAAMLWPTVIGALATLGLEESMTYHMARARESVGRLLGSAFALCSIQAVLFTAATVVVVPLALHRHDSTTITAALVYSLYVTFNTYGVAFNGALNGMHRYSQYNAVRSVIAVAVVAAQTVLLIVGAFSVIVLVSAFVACYAVCGFVLLALVRRTKPGRLSADRRTMRMIFAYGVRSNMSSTSTLLNQRLDQLVISAFLSARELGLYVTAVTFTLFTPLIGSSVAIAALPNIASLDDDGVRVQLARRLVGLTLIVSICLSVPILLLAPYLIDLFFGSAFEAGAHITRVLAVASIALSTNRALEAVLRGVGRPLAAGGAELVALGGTVVGLAALLPTLGLIGAAWASLFAYCVSSAWMLVRIRSHLGVPARQILTPDREGLEQLARLGWRLLGRARGATTS